MAVKRRVKWISGLNSTVPILRSIESAVTADFDDVIKGVFTGLTNPYVIRGMEIDNAAPSGNPNNIQIKLANSSILNTTATEPGSILTFDASEPDILLNSSNPNVIGSWTSNAINYVAMDYRRETDPNSTDNVAYWSQSQMIEIQTNIPIAYDLDYRIIITTSGFGNYLPLYQVYVSQPANQGQQITYIENCIPYLYRLGSGGLLPNPFFSFPWIDYNGSRMEGSLTQTGGVTPTSTFWQAGDFAIQNEKDAFDATWTRIKEITGSALWYMDTNAPPSGGGGSSSTLNLNDLSFDSGAYSVWTSSGSFSFALGATITAQVGGGYTTTYPTKLSSIYNSANWSTYYTGLISMVDYNSVPIQQGEGTLTSANGTINLISGVNGTFNALDNVTASMTVPITSLNVTSPGSGVAQITLASWTLFDGTHSLFDSDAHTFTGSISGATDPAYNATDVTITVTGTQTILTYPVSTSIVSAATGNLTLNGVVWLGTMAASTVGNPNPFAGPVQFNADVNIEAIIGELTITISKYALAIETSTNTIQSVANGYYGPGTFQLDANEDVAYLILDRELPVGGPGAVYTSASNGLTITGPTPTYTGYFGSQTARIGDYVKFLGSSNVEWRQITNITTSGGTSTLTLDYALDAAWESYTGTLIVTRGTYGVLPGTTTSEVVIQVTNRRQVPANPNVFWIAFREDKIINSTDVPTVYLRQLQLQLGETRDVNDGISTNLLIYTGANSDANQFPAYSVSTSEPGFEFSQTLVVSAVDPLTNMITFTTNPDSGFVSGDLIYDGTNTYTIAYPISSNAVISEQALQGTISIGSNVTYKRPDFSIVDGDNLTVADRKLDRTLGALATNISRPVYDESVYVQVLTATGSGTIASGDFVVSSNGGLGWVLAGQGEVLNPIGGGVVSGAILIHNYTPLVPTAFTSGATLTQVSSSSTQTIATSITDTSIYGTGSSGQLLKLPPNHRVVIPNNGTSGPTAGAVYPQAAYLQNSGAGGGELLVIANDTTRECSIDYNEIQSGPGTNSATRAQIQILRPLPEYTRLRFRNLATYGVSTPGGASGAITLQSAYNGSTSGAGLATINTNGSKPVWIIPPSPSTLGLRVTGLVETDGTGSGFLSFNDGESLLGGPSNRFLSSWVETANIKAQSNYTGSQWVQTTAAVTTVGTTVTTALTLAVPSASAVRMKISSVCRDDTSIAAIPAQSSFSIDVCISNEGSGAVIVGAPITEVIGMSPNAFQHMMTVSVSSGNVLVQVAGGTGQTCNWALTVDYQFVEVSS